MANRRRVTLALAVLGVLAVLIGVGRWYQSRQAATPGQQTAEVTAIVSNGNDRGPGSLREALFVVASAREPATISLQAREIVLETALPPIITAKGLRIVAQEPGVVIDAKALRTGAVLDVAGANTAIEGVTLRNCFGAAILLRGTRFRLQSTTIERCDVGVEVAENAAEVLLEDNRFIDNRIGVRFAAAPLNSSVVKNEFSGDKDAGLWAVRSRADGDAAPLHVRENRFSDSRTGLVVGNVAALIERNDVINSREAAVHVVGAGATVRGNRITGGAAMGIVAENARSAIIENNEIDGVSAYGVMVRNSTTTLVRGNRMHNCGYGMAFVLGAPGGPSNAVENTIIAPRFNGIDVVGDSPILRRNQVLRPRALALNVKDFEPKPGQRIASRPFLDDNSFGEPDTTVAAGHTRPEAAASPR